MAVGTRNSVDFCGRLRRGRAAASVRLAAGLLVTLGLLAGCTGPLGTSLPSPLLRATPGNTDIWRAAGFNDPVAYRLPNRPAYTDAPATARIARLTYLVPAGSAWTKSDLVAFTRDVPDRFAACAIGFNEIRLVEAKFPSGFSKTASFGPDDLQGLGHKLAGLGEAAGMTVLFIDTLENARSYADAGGVAFVEEDPPFAVISRKAASGRLLRPEQIVVHEIGHLLGLGHVPATTPDGTPNIDLMHPRGCLHCSFSVPECEIMRKQVAPRANERDRSGPKAE